MLVLIYMGTNMAAETCVTEFCYKSVNLSLEELKNVTIILYSNTITVQIVEFPEISHLLNQHHSSLACHVNATSRKTLKVQARSITKPRAYSKRKFVLILVFKLLLNIMKVKSQGYQ